MIDDTEAVEADGLDNDDLLSDEPSAVREALRRKIKTEGALAAYDALISVCRDPRAAAPARATAATALFRAGGFLSKKAEEEDSDNTPLEQMTQEQMVRALAKAEADKRAHERRVTKARRGRNSRDSDGGVFS